MFRYLLEPEAKHLISFLEDSKRLFWIKIFNAWVLNVIFLIFQGLNVERQSNIKDNLSLNCWYFKDHLRLKLAFFEIFVKDSSEPEMWTLKTNNKKLGINRSHFKEPWTFWMYDLRYMQKWCSLNVHVAHIYGYFPEMWMEEYF